MRTSIVCAIVLAMGLLIDVGSADTADDIKAKASSAWNDITAAAGKAGEWFSQKVKSAADMVGVTKEDMKTNIENTKDFLSKTKDKVGADLKAKFEEWIGKLDTLLKKANESTDQTVESVKTEWKNLADDIYTNGIQKVNKGASANVAATTSIAMSLIGYWLVAQR